LEEKGETKDNIQASATSEKVVQEESATSISPHTTNDPDLSKKTDDEAVLDFSKIKSFFKDKKDKVNNSKETAKFSEHPQHQSSIIQSSEKKTSEDSFDLQEIKTKAKKIFQGLKTNFKGSKKESSEKSEDIQFDLKKVVAWSKNNTKWLIPLVCIILAVFTSTYFRMTPAYLPITDDWAESTVYNYYQNQITQQINQQYPNLPDQNKQTLINQEFQKTLEQNKEQISAQVAEVSQQYKSQLQDENGQTYLLAIDPYYWFAEARNYIRYGQFGDSYNDEGKRVFSLRNGRDGAGNTKIPFHPLFIAWTYKVLSVFNNNLSIMHATFLNPVIIIALSLIPAFFIGRRFGGNVGGWFAAMILAINSALLSRTPGGFSDTDPYNVFFPLFIAWIFLESFYAESLKKKLVLAGLSGFLTGLYFIAWKGSWFIFGFVLVAILFNLIFNIITFFKKNKFKLNDYSKNKEIRRSAIIGITYFVFSGIFVSFFAGVNTFTSILSYPFNVVNLKDVGVGSLWPNVLTTVAEFNVVSLSSIISQMGGKLLFWISLMGLVMLFGEKEKINLKNSLYFITSGIYYLVILSLKDNLNNALVFIILISLPILAGLIKKIYLKEDKNNNVAFILFLTIWFASTIYGFTKGIRFSILMVPAFALSFGVALGITFKQLSGWLSREMKLQKVMSKVIVLVVLSLLLISPLSSAVNTTKNQVPSMNDAWYNTLIKIKDNTTKAMITSWWDFGHWFYAISERGVTFDGGGQGKKIHWVGKTLLTDDENTSIGTLRMLNCGNQQPPQLLEEYFNGDTVKAVNVLNKMMDLNDKGAATSYLQAEDLTGQQISNILNITYCDDLIEQFFITSQDMIGKAGVWAHFGAWDFQKALIWQKINEMTRNKAVDYLVTNFNMTEEEADKTYSEVKSTKADNWIAPWPGYHSGLSSCSKNSEKELICNTNVNSGTVSLKIDLEEMNVSIAGNTVVPNTIVYPAEGKIISKELPGSHSGFSVVLIPSGENWQFMLADPLLANSMFTKLFFYDGLGLDCFEKFDDARQVTGERIITWKVDFSCGQK